MNKYSFIVFLFTAFLLFSCSKRHVPEKSAPETTVTTLPEATPISENKPAPAKKRNFTPKKKDIIPNTITVNDAAAKKSIDGRLYYDLLGHRYWKNYKDGKYYLFNQSMYSNPAFKAPK